MPIRSWQKHHVGRLLLTFQIAGEDAYETTKEISAIEETIAACTGVLGEYGIPATWLVDRVDSVSARSMFASATAKSELGLLMNQNNDHTAQENIAQVDKELDLAKSNGMPIHTLAVPDRQEEPPVNWAVRRNITSIVELHPAESIRRGQRNGKLPQPIHYGLWRVPTMLRLPSRRSILANSPVRRALRQASEEGQMQHLVVDLLPYAFGRHGGVRAACRWLREIGKLKLRQFVRVDTVGDYVADIAGRYQAVPQRSILRRVA